MTGVRWRASAIAAALPYLAPLPSCGGGDNPRAEANGADPSLATNSVAGGANDSAAVDDPDAGRR